jgi:hypothetical protein
MRRPPGSLTPVPSPIALPCQPGEGRPRPIRRGELFSAPFPPLPGEGGAMGEGGQGGEALAAMPCEGLLP